MNKSPLVSIVIPAYNAEKFIGRAIDSLLTQTYRNIEIIVVDDGSKDKTAEIVKSYKDTRVKYIHQVNRGQGAARNKGIKESQGEYITFLDADDLYLPSKIEQQVEFLLKNPHYKIVYCNALHYYTDKPDTILKKRSKPPSGDIFLYLLTSSLINPNTIMMHRDILSEYFLFQEGLRGRYSEEWELYLRLSNAGFLFGNIDKDLVLVEIRANSVTQWETQWIFKDNTVKMFENILPDINNIEQWDLMRNDILKYHKKKLAISYLIINNKEDFFKTVLSIYRKEFAYILMFIVNIIPAPMLKHVIIKLWKKRQYKSFEIIDWI